MSNTKEEPKWRMDDLLDELFAYLDQQEITSANIGDLRRECFVPWDSKWNGIVREQTASREREPDPLENEAVDNELRRWQDAIRDKMIAMGVPDFKIDGVGCDSGDPLDLTLAEVGQGLAYFIDQLEAEKQVASNDIRTR